MCEKTKKATTIFSIKKATIKDNTKEFNDKTLNNDINKEYIIIIGTQLFQHREGLKKIAYLKDAFLGSDAGPNGKFMFIHQAIRRVKKNQEYDYNWTILLYKEGYTTAQINRTKECFKTFASKCNFLEINSYQEAINYINTRKTKELKDNKLRTQVLIERIFFFCHGEPLKLSMMYRSGFTKGDTKMDWDENVVKKLDKNAFSKTAKIYSFACRTGLGNPEIDETIFKEKPPIGNVLPIYIDEFDKYDRDNPMPLLPTKSLAQKIANQTGAVVLAYICRSDYSETLNTSDELDFMNYYRAGDGEKLYRKNEEYNYLLDKNNRTKEDIKRYKELSKIEERREYIDGKVFDFEGARYPVKGGNTPIGTPKDMKTYRKI